MRFHKSLSVFILGAALTGAGRVGAEPNVATFSIVAYDSTHAEWGVAVASKFVAVGSVVPWAKAGVGAVATQAFANTKYGSRGLELLERGTPVLEALRLLRMDDSQPETRQVGMVDARGNSGTFTGSRCREYAGGIRGPGFAVQGNLLAGEDVVKEMAAAYAESRGLPLAERLLAALEQGEAAGGDSRGRQSAAMLVVKEGGGYGGHNDRYIDLRVDDHPDPIPELKRLYQLHAMISLPAVHARLGDQALERGDRRTADMELSRAVALYLDAIAAAPREAAPKNSLAWFYVQHRVNLDEALALAEQAHELEPDSWEVLDTLAEVYFAKGNVKEAHDASVAALKVSPENAYLKGQVERFRLAMESLTGP